MALLLTNLLTPEEAFSGFSSPAVVTVWAIYIVSAALMRTGVADYMGDIILLVAGKTEGRLVGVIMTTVAVMSAFMNNIGATAVLMPVVIRIGRQVKVPASKLLMPLAFGSLVGGVTTLIGTPPNLLVSNALEQANLPPFELLDFTPVGLIIMFSSIAYMVLIGRHLLPNNAPKRTQNENLSHEYQLGQYLSELHVMSDSPLIGQTLVETGLGENFDLTVMGIIRDGRTRLGIMPNAHIAAGDILLVEGHLANALKAIGRLGLALVQEVTLDRMDLVSDETALAEIVLVNPDAFVGQTLRELHFRTTYGLTVLALWRSGKQLVGHLRDEPLFLGDTLLIHGRYERIKDLQNSKAFVLLNNPVEVTRPLLHKAPISFIIFISMISLVLFGYLHISTAAVLGAILSILTGCITMDEAYEAINWESVFLIAGMLPLGLAMEQTGTADFLADQILNLIGDRGPLAAMLGLFLLTTGLTAFMSNAAAAVLVAPIAINTAFSLQVNPHAFVMGVAIAASNSFVTPIAHQVCVLVHGPGDYRFFDYARVGFPLTLIIWVISLIFLPIFWPL
ncbi:MAG TPA: SLC13 family permease [Anaerolineae bacterium]|nr:SLC13 family permease [Anaerolineae bacterium]